ncbi:hypothetical protein L3X38_030084 [Prunus dulcis]|uniref:CCHC-type domain-containing protein n=1 Tax=Prunus dulcis TaxID=3755 RepID=A0AAD4UN33_PRUDU|nr:hypothetical protein L3X38_030084 [Prunus dulcis]
MMVIPFWNFWTIPKENWSNAFYPGKKYGEMCSNLAECFNSWILIEPILTDYYRSCYGIPIALVLDIEKEAPEGLEDFIVKPPLTRKPPGRPRTKRIKSRWDEKKCYKCSRCGQGGQHNRRTCNSQI